MQSTTKKETSVHLENVTISTITFSIVINHNFDIKLYCNRRVHRKSQEPIAQYEIRTHYASRSL